MQKYKLPTHVRKALLKASYEMHNLRFVEKLDMGPYTTYVFIDYPSQNIIQVTTEYNIKTFNYRTTVHDRILWRVE